MQAHVVIALAWALALSGAACGLGTGGLALGDVVRGEDGGVTVDGASPSGDDGPSPGDASTGRMDGTAPPGPDAGAEASVSGDGGAGPCVSAIPSGWSLVAYEAARSACPAGYGGSHDEYSGATAAPGACSCACQITTAPDCTSGMITTSYGGGVGGPPSCPTPGETIAVNGSTCTVLSQGGGLSQFFASTPVALSGGSCEAIAQGNTAQLMTQGVRYCDVPPSGAEAVCEGTAPPSFSACIVSSGDVACPTGSVFTNKTVIVDDEMLTCSACTACAVGGTCTMPTVTLYSDTQCTQQVTQLPSDGSCVPSNGNTRTVAAARYSAQTSATCQASGSSASVTPQGPHTLCCR